MYNFSFDIEQWKSVASKMLKQALLLKFSQNEILKQKLLMTGTKQLGEASPYDHYFWCGLGMNDPNAGDVTKWTGQNLLGKTLMEVRTELK